MWIQLWNKEYNPGFSFKSILIEADTITTAIKFIQKIYPDKDISAPLHTDLLDNPVNILINGAWYTILVNESLEIITEFERQGNKMHNLFTYKQFKCRMPKESRYISLNNYLKLPNVKIYYKKDVDTVLA